MPYHSHWCTTLSLAHRMEWSGSDCAFGGGGDVGGGVGGGGGGGA